MLDGKRIILLYMERETKLFLLNIVFYHSCDRRNRMKIRMKQVEPAFVDKKRESLWSKWVTKSFQNPQFISE